MKELTQFRAVHSSGLLMPSQATVTALALIFEKIHLPRNIELVVQFSKRYRFADYDPDLDKVDVKIEPEDPHTPDPFAELNDGQKATAHLYLKSGMEFICNNLALFPDVFETEAFKDSEPIEVKLVKKGRPGQLNTYRCSLRPLELSGEDIRTIPRLVRSGYVPVATCGYYGNTLNPRASQLASLLAMRSVELVLPRFCLKTAA